MADLCGDQDAGLIAIAQRNPSLTSLYFYSSKECTISDASFTALCVNCPRLQSITLENCVNLTDASLLTIAEHCRKLRELHISSCSQIRNLANGELINEKCKLLDANTRWYAHRVHGDVRCFIDSVHFPRSFELLMQYK